MLWLWVYASLICVRKLGECVGIEGLFGYIVVWGLKCDFSKNIGGEQCVF